MTAIRGATERRSCEKIGARGVIPITGTGDNSKTNASEAPEPYQELVTLLVTLEHNIVLYPQEHDSIKRVTEALRSLLDALLTLGRKLTLIVSHDRISLNGTQLTAGNARNRKLALFLGQRSIVSVTMKYGLTVRELVRFFEILHELPPKTDIHEYPALAEALTALPHMDVARFELKALRVLNQEQVEAPSGTEHSDTRWEKILQSGSGAEDGDFSGALAALFPDFAPSLRESIRAVTSGDTGDDDGAQLAEELRERLPEELILAMGMHALNDNRQISPALQKLLSSLSLIRENLTSPPTLLQGGIGADSIQKLFERERYEDFVSPEYGDQLDAFTRVVEAGAGAAEGRLPAFLEAELREEQVGRWLARGLVSLLGESSDEDILRDCAQQLEAMLTEFLNQKDYDFLCALHRTLERLGDGSGGYARRLLEKFTGEDFIVRLQSELLVSSGNTRKALESLVLVSGPQNTAWLLELYDQNTDQWQRTRILKLLLLFKNDAAEAALDRIMALDIKKLKPILRLISLFCVKSDDNRLYPLLNAGDQEIRTEVMRMLLTAGRREPIPLLLGMLRSRSREEAIRAVKIAGEYRVGALAGELARQLRARYISDTSALCNRYILESLNRIGEVSVLPRLRKLFKTRLSLTPDRLRATREILLENLSGYPDHALKWLLENSAVPRRSRGAPPRGTT